MADIFSGNAVGLTSPATRHFAITPADSDMAQVPRCISCTVSGNVVIRDAGGVDVTYPMVAGDWMPFRAVQVRVTGTTATVIGWY